MHPHEIHRAAVLLTRGGLVAFPTETVYGLGADAANPGAVKEIFALKGRPADHPLIIHLPAPARLDRPGFSRLLSQWAAEVPPIALALAEAYWPGPLTLILRRARRVSDIVTGGLDTVGLRVPAHRVAAALLHEFGRLVDGPCGIAAPSANRFGSVSPTSAEHVVAEFDEKLAGSHALDQTGQLPVGVAGIVLDGGACTVGVESTIVDLSSGWLRVLRPGGVTDDQLEQVAPRCAPGPGCDSPASRIPRAPGMLPQHYAPHAPLHLLESKELSTRLKGLVRRLAPATQVALLGPADLLAAARLPAGVVPVSLGNALEEQAQRLYAALREADAAAGEIWAVLPPPTGIGVAIRDRLRRAAGLGELPDDP